MAKWPAIAVAAATAGETRCVRPPLPWRPSKLRFDVDAQRSPGRELVGVHRQAHRAPGLAPLEAGGGEHLVEALGLGLGLHLHRARHHQRAHAVAAPCGRAATSAAARRSSMREFVHEPMNTVSTAISRIGVPGLEAHVAQRALGGVARVGVGERVGVGHDVVDGDRLRGVGAPRDRRPQRRRRRCTTSLSNVAPSSVTSARQSSSARSHAAPVGANSRPSR